VLHQRHRSTPLLHPVGSSAGQGGAIGPTSSPTTSSPRRPPPRRPPGDLPHPGRAHPMAPGQRLSGLAEPLPGLAEPLPGLADRCQEQTTPPPTPRGRKSVTFAAPRSPPR